MHKSKKYWLVVKKLLLIEQSSLKTCILIVKTIGKNLPLNKIFHDIQILLEKTLVLLGAQRSRTYQNTLWWKFHWRIKYHCLRISHHVISWTWVFCSVVCSCNWTYWFAYSTSVVCTRILESLLSCCFVSITSKYVSCSRVQVLLAILFW